MAELFERHFRQLSTFATLLHTQGEVKWQELYDFLYERDYDAAFLEAMAFFVRTKTPLVDVIKRIHTLETLNTITINFTSDEKQAISQRLLKKLSEDIISLYEELPEPVLFRLELGTTDAIKKVMEGTNAEIQKPFKIVESLRRQLEIDGYIYQDGKLYFNESSVIPEKEEQNLLIKKVQDLAFTNTAVIEHHLSLSENHYLEGRWGDSIGNARSALEAIVSEITKRVHKKAGLSSKIPATPTGQRDFLESHGLLDKKEKETLEKVYGLISDTGNHPNISEQDQARLGRHLALTLSQYLLLITEKLYPK